MSKIMVTQTRGLCPLRCHMRQERGRTHGNLKAIFWALTFFMAPQPLCVLYLIKITISVDDDELYPPPRYVIISA